MPRAAGTRPTRSCCRARARRPTRSRAAASVAFDNALRGELFHELRRDMCGHPANVLAGVEFDDVGADELAAERVEKREHFAHGQSSGLAMRDAWRVGRIEAVEIERDVDVAGRGWTRAVGPGAH